MGRWTRFIKGADIVGLIVGTNGACDIGSLGPDINSMFSVTKWSCPTGCYTFGHEIGQVALRVELRDCRMGSSMDSVLLEFSCAI